VRSPWLLLVCVAVAAPVAAQGLGDAAKQEKSRRTAKPETPPRVFTNADLSTEEAATTDPDDEASPEEGDEEEALVLDEVGAADPLREELDREREERALAEREWRARFAEARARFREAEARCWQEVVRTEFKNGIPVQMKVQEFVESEEFRRTKQDLADLQEEFRRTGLPPGWARE